MERGNWREYHNRTSETQPRKSLVRALEMVRERGTALDLGAGSLGDSRFLLDAGFQKVIAVDADPGVEERASKIDSEKLEVVISSFADYKFPERTFDLVNAQYCLPFNPPEVFRRVFDNVKKSLKVGGIFTGQLFGKRDGWAGTPGRIFHTKEEVGDLLAGMELVDDVKEVEQDGFAADGSPKRWHFFIILARKID